MTFLASSWAKARPSLRQRIEPWSPTGRPLWPRYPDVRRVKSVPKCSTQCSLLFRQRANSPSTVSTTLVTYGTTAHRAAGSLIRIAPRQSPIGSSGIGLRTVADPSSGSDRCHGSYGPSTGGATIAASRLLSSADVAACRTIASLAWSPLRVRSSTSSLAPAIDAGDASPAAIRRR